MRNTIKILVALTVLLWAAAIIFPLSGYLFGAGGGVSAAVALMCALVISYREEEVVSTRGGPVYKKDSKITFFINYLIAGIILFGLLLGCTFMFIAQLGTVW
jgi:4-hydroxybenzoate polyprenyltransferase